MDMLLLGLSQLVSAVAIIAVMKTDIRWIKEWCQNHESNDQRRFNDLTFEDRRIEEESKDIGNRVARLEGAQR